MSDIDDTKSAFQGEILMGIQSHRFEYDFCLFFWTKVFRFLLYNQIHNMIITLRRRST